MTPLHKSLRGAERRVLSIHQMSLLDAAIRADENAVAAAIHAGADVNTLNAAGRSALVCAIGGDR